MHIQNQQSNNLDINYSKNTSLNGSTTSPVTTTINLTSNTNLNLNSNKRNKLHESLSATPLIHPKRQSSQSSINTTNQPLNKRGPHFYTSNSNNLIVNKNSNNLQTNPVIASQYPFLASYSQKTLNSLKPVFYNHSNTPTAATNFSNNNYNPSAYNFGFTSTTNQINPKLNYNLLQSSLKKVSNNNKLLYQFSDPLTSSLNQLSNNCYSKQYPLQQQYQVNKDQFQFPESIEQRRSLTNQNMNNQENLLNANTQSQQAAQQQQQQQQQQQSRIILTEEEQILISNLQETYKAILKLEVETQQGCADVNQKLLENNTGSELNNELWSVYKNVVQLLDHYYDFLLYALSPTSTRTGKPLVSNYRILKRMWVYGIVAFLEVLKNVVSISAEHEVCACFVSYSFNIISCLTDPELGIECWWAEKLGDLSRMAIALYPARYMDWKMSSVHWYQESIKTQFGHGKIYYHMCSVENDNLEALMLIGKGVNCRDPFVPTQQYLRMIVDNVCSQRNMLTSVEMAMIDFVKIHKILLLPTYSVNEEMINIVSHYSSNFGVDNTNIDFFQVRPDCTTSDINDKVTFWFQKGANFALSNIYHLMGFGICSNPFAKIFDLPDALKERKEKKDRREQRRRSRSDSASIQAISNDNSTSIDPTDPEFSVISTANNLDEKYWFLLLEHINKGVIELSMKMLKQYLSGPVQTSTPHTIIWLYFLISICESVKIYPTSKPMFYRLLQAVFPWKVLVLYLNDILCIVRSVPELRSRYKTLLKRINSTENPNTTFFQLFGSNETLWEVWKCWGSLWFDRVCPKGDYINVFETGIKNNIFDTPLSGEIYNSHEDGERYIRILLLAGYICDYFPEFGLERSNNIFKFAFQPDSFNIDSNNLTCFTYFIGDSRLQALLKFSGYQSSSKSNKETSTTKNNEYEVENEIENKEEEERIKDNDTYSKTDNIEENEVYDFNKWTGENDLPKLPMWDHNSYGFMTDFINNQYPAVLAHRSGLELISFGNNDEDNEYEEDSVDEYDENDTDEQYQTHDNETYEVTSEGGSVSAKAPLSTGLGTSSDAGNDNLQMSSIKPPTIKGDIGDFMDASITFISLDTNVWLKHCGRIFKCVRSRIFKLAIPLTVFQELRSLRKSNDSLVAESATRAVIIARQLYSENVVLAIRSDGTTASHINETREFEQNENWRLNSDELILQSIKLNDAFGKSLCLGYGYSVGELPKLPIFEEPGKIAGVYNGAYHGGYSVSHFPTSLNPNIPNNQSATKICPNSNSVIGSNNNIISNSTLNNECSNLPGYLAPTIDTTGTRGESLRPIFISSKTTTLSKSDASKFRYNILITDDHEMCLRSETIGLKQLRSSEWFKIVDKLSFGRCYD
jgi:hypothetical protein